MWQASRAGAVVVAQLRIRMRQSGADQGAARDSGRCRAGKGSINTGRCAVAKTILVVEDDAHVLAILTDCLKGEGYVVVAAGDRRQALKWARNVPPDLILLDMMLPAMSGYVALAVLKATPATAAIPVVGISAKATVEDIELASDLGVDAYIGKPIRIAQLLNVVRAYT
jgi:CheY-like chemotaxis protein